MDEHSHHRPRTDWRFGFAGTPEFASRILEQLLAAGRIPAVVYTQPDRPTGRGRKLQPPAVKQLALARQLPVEQPASLRGPAASAALADWRLDLLVVAAYGLILPASILGVPRLGCVNVHASLLPRWRGAAPVERAIMAGDTRTGVCIMAMDAGLDTGPVFDCRALGIDESTDGPTLERSLAELGSSALLDVLRRLPDVPTTPQNASAATYATKLTRADAEIDWSRPAIEIHRQVRALTGRMPAFSFLGSRRLSVLEAHPEPGDASPPGTLLNADPRGIRVACGSGVLSVQRLKLDVGKGNPLRAADAVNGYRELFRAGALLRTEPAAP